MPEVAFAIPGDLATRTGGYIYDRRVLALLPANGVAARHVVLPGSFPHPDAGDLAASARALAAAPAGAVLLIDGLAYGALPADLVRGLGRTVVALVHHPLCLETGLEADTAARLRASERAALAEATAAVVTSRATRDLLAAEFGVSPAKLAIAEPGTDPAPRTAVRTAGGPVKLLAVGAVSPRKGYDVLIAALAGLAELDWRLTIAGALDRHAEAATALSRAIAAAGIAPRVRLAGDLTDRELADEYAHADAFVMASHYEGYGMAIAEALARGLPLVCTTGGAAGTTAPDAAALKVAPGDTAGLRAALAQVIGDGALRLRLAEAAWRAGQDLPRWDDTAARVAAAIRRVAP